MGTSFLWLEITGKCQLNCEHCYAASGPSGDHGVMAMSDWLRVLDQAAAMKVKMVQFIGGEPTLHDGLPDLATRALNHGMDVEIYSNLVHVSDRLWELFSRDNVSLATSYYSDDATEHASITKRPTYARTKANIAEALRRGIPLRAGVVDLRDGQRAAEAQRELIDLGVPTIGYDKLRQVGRGVRDESPDIDQLCGNCGDGVAAVSPGGDVWPCVFSRWLPIGNVLDESLDEILSSAEADRIRAELAHEFTQGRKLCSPNCDPINCGPRCQPMTSCGPKSCAPLKEFCSPNYRGPASPCEPRSRMCQPLKCDPGSPRLRSADSLIRQMDLPAAMSCQPAPATSSQECQPTCSPSKPRLDDSGN